MWIEQKKDITVICQGMGKNAFIFYHRFWGFIAKAECPTPERVQEIGKCVFTLTLSQQARPSELERIIRTSCGEVWGKLHFIYKWVEDDYICRGAKMSLVGIMKARAKQ